MKKTLFLLFALPTLFSCQQEVVEEQAFGSMSLSVANNPVVEDVTRAGGEVSIYDFNINVFCEEELKYSFPFREYIEPILVPVGQYTAFAESVTEEQSLTQPTEWGQIRYSGSDTQWVRSGRVTQFDIECRVANSAVSVIFDASLERFYSDIKVDVYTTEDRQLTYTQDNAATAVGYFNPGTQYYVFTGTYAGETIPRTFSGQFNTAAATRTSVTFKTTTQEGTLGKPEIEVDYTCEDFYETVTLDPTEGLQ